MRSALEWARVRALAADGVSEREIARRLGMNRRTVARLAEPPRYRRAPAGSKQLGEGGEEGRDNDIVEYVNAGLIDEFTIALSPVLSGSGIRLFEGVDEVSSVSGVVGGMESRISNAAPTGPVGQ